MILSNPPRHLALRRAAVRLGTSRARLRRAGDQAGFTLLELIIVLTMIGILAGLAIPNLIRQPTRAKESVLKNNLRTLREVIDQHHGDKGAYPPSLEALVDEEYLRAIPIDPFTSEREWGVVYQDSPDDLSDPDSIAWDVDLEVEDSAGIQDVHSLFEETALDGTPYAEW